MTGETDEDHMAAVMFNLLAAEHTKFTLENECQHIFTTAFSGNRCTKCGIPDPDEKESVNDE